MKIKTAVTVGVAALLILTGCSSGSDDSAAPAATSAAATSAAATESEAMGSDAMGSEAMSSEAMSSDAMGSDTAAGTGTIVDVAAGNPDFSTLVAAVEAAGLGETLSGTGPFTVFAPTNEAFEALPAGVLDMLLLPENKETLTKVLTYHVIPGEVTSDKVTAGDVTTVEGSTIAITTDGGVKINDTTTVTAVDVDASNGVIHVIDKVLIPAEVAATL